jgi:hypothetical protein
LRSGDDVTAIGGLLNRVSPTITAAEGLLPAVTIGIRAKKMAIKAEKAITIDF